MAAADPKAVWVMQGWMFHYNNKFWQPQQIKALLNAVPNDQMIVLDLYSDSHPVWNRTEAYYGKPWIWSMLQNFGGNISLFGRMRHVAADPAIALHDPESKNMRGIGVTPEGIEQNPALFALMLENVWRDTPIDADAWVNNYAKGATDKPMSMHPKPGIYCLTRFIQQRIDRRWPRIDHCCKANHAKDYRQGINQTQITTL
jgi:alpha-N-acetylglucosaminidase